MLGDAIPQTDPSSQLLAVALARRGGVVGLIWSEMAQDPDSGPAFSVYFRELDVEGRAQTQSIAVTQRSSNSYVRISLAAGTHTFGTCFGSRFAWAYGKETDCAVISADGGVSLLDGGLDYGWSTIAFGSAGYMVAESERNSLPSALLQPVDEQANRIGTPAEVLISPGEAQLASDDAGYAFFWFYNGPVVDLLAPDGQAIDGGGRFGGIGPGTSSTWSGATYAGRPAALWVDLDGRLNFQILPQPLVSLTDAGEWDIASAKLVAADGWYGILWNDPEADGGSLVYHAVDENELVSPVVNVGPYVLSDAVRVPEGFLVASGLQMVLLRCP